MISDDSAASSAPAETWQRIGLLVDVFKLRIGLAIGLCALVGMRLAPAGPIEPGAALGVFLAVVLASAAAGACNHIAERDLDRRMARTWARPFASGRFRAGPRWRLAIALLGATAVALAVAAGNVQCALYTALGALTYGVIYTLWLKRRTPWNIVVGGLAGSFAVLAGAAAAAPALGTLPLIFTLILFLWTPPHFWSLAIAYRDDYVAAGVPMLPVIVGNARCARTIFAAACVLVAVSLLPAAFGLGRVYLAAAFAGGALFLWRSARLAKTPDRKSALASFHASLLQLSAVLCGALVDAALRA